MPKTPTAPQTQGVEPAGWQQALLTSIGAPVTQGNLSFLTAWFTEEHGTGATTGNPGKGGLFNPFDTTLGMKGSTTLIGNTAGVQNYVTPAQGIAATTSTLEESQYSTLLGDLRSGNASLGTLEAAQQASPWGQWSSYPSSVSGVPSTSTENILYDTIYKGNANQPASGGSLTPAQITAINQYAGYSNNQAQADVNAINGVTNALTSPFSSLFTWIEKALGEVLMILIGVVLVGVGLVITFRQEGTVEKGAAVAAVA